MDPEFERASSENSGQYLSLKVQEYLWQQVGNSMKIKLQNGKYEQTCVAFERLYSDRNKELKISIPEVYADIKSISRSTFMQGLFPYIIHCCAAILEQRRQLGLSDKLSVSATKVFLTLHKILLEASQDVENCLNFTSIELFVQLIIPNLYNLNERDLTFSLAGGILLWQPLWNHSSPTSSLLALPIVNAVDDTTLSVGGTRVRPVITYFDVALLKVMMLKNWSFNGYRWGLRYIQRHLELVLVYHGFTCENSIVLDLLKQFNSKKISNASVNQFFVENKENRYEMKANTQLEDPQEEKNNLPKQLHQFATEEGELKLTFIIKIIKKLLVTENLVRLSGEMLFIIAQLIDLSIESYSKQQIKFEFESLLICLLNTIKMLGCDQCSTVLRGTKSDHLRSLAQIYLKKLLAHKEETAKAVIIDYVETVNLSSAVVFFHSFMGYCTSNFAKREAKRPGMGYQDSFEIDPNTTTNYATYLDNKGSNEVLILKWTTNILIRKFMEDWNKVKTSGRSELFTPIKQLVKYLQLQHHLVFRKIVMCGLLDSFDKSQHKRSKLPTDNRMQRNPSPRPDSPLTPEPDPPDNGGKMKTITKVIFGLMAGRTASQSHNQSQNQNQNQNQSATLPHNLSAASRQRSDSTNSNDSSTTTGTNPAMKHGGFFTLPRTFRGTNIMEAGPSTSQRSLDNDAGVAGRGTLVNGRGLYEGLKQLRCLLQVTAPGITPEEAVVAAMLDLEAPVVARAAYLLELAYFVHLCNKNYWPCLVQFAPSQGGTRDEPDANMLKHKAGVLFHKWGMAIGKKLEDIVLQEKNDMETNRSRLNFDEKSLEFMYQGDIDSVSPYCPYALRNVACQLLFEITAFLRESYVHIAAQSSTPVESPSINTKQVLTAVKSDASSKKKQSVASVIRKMSALPRRKQSNSHLLPLSASTTEQQQYSPGKVRKKQSGVARHRVTRKTSLVSHRRSSRTSGLERQTSFSVNDVDENYIIDFPWLNIVIQMNKMTDLLCSHSTHSCLSSCPVAQMRSCIFLMEALNTVYGNCLEEVHGPRKRMDRQDEKSDPVLKYLNENVVSLSHIPYSLLCKGARVMDVSQLHETMAFSWEVLNYPDDKLKAAATGLFLISGVLFMQMESTISEFLMKQLTSVDVADRAKAVERLGTLWNYQYSVYDHLEDHDKRFLKIALPKVEFTVPSRPVGIEPQIAPDAPWLPNAQNFQDVDLSDDEDDFYFMDSEKQSEAKTKKRAKKLNELKENYLVSAEPFSFQAVQKLNIFNNTGGEGEDDQSNTSYQKMKEDAMTIHWDCPVQSFFPESMEEGLLQLIRLLDDTTLTAMSNHSVGGLARQLIWKCMVDNPEIFFRRFLEKITVKQYQTELIMLLRKLLVHFPVLPPHTARYLFNNLVGVISLYNRTNRPYTQEKIAAIMPLFSLIAPSVTKIYFKELQMSLRRENVDDIMMVTANGVCAKEIVLYPEKETLVVIESQTFRELLTEDNIAENLWLVDKHSGQIMEHDYRIRDVYTHKRGFPRPALKLERLDESYAFRKREKQALINKLINISQLEFCKSVFDSLPNKRHVLFLYTELYQKASFPRKAIDIEFDLCAGVELGKEIFGMDVIYKDNWVEFISTLLKGLSSTLSFYGEEMINIFIDPINGALLLHCEDVLILRSSLAALINIVICYEKTFSLHGFGEILPTMLRVYSQHEGNQLVKEAIEFTIYQFFFIHGGSFILQMFASVAPILIPDNNSDINPLEQIDMVPAKNLFNLLESLDRKHVDTLDILSLVDNGDKIKPYGDPVNEENDRSSIDLSIRLALTIISYKSESKRALQMMYVLSTLIPYYLNHLKSKKEGAPEVDVKKEMKNMRYLIKYVATIIELYEHLRNSIHGVAAPDHSIEATTTVNVHWLWHSIQNTLTSFTQWFSSHGREERPEGDDMERASIIEEGENPIIISPSNMEQRTKLDEFYLPRTILLTLASDFALNCTETYNTLRQMMHSEVSGKVQNGGFHDVIEDENSLILIDIAISMLKLVFLDHHVLRNPGLERFLIEAMPLINWKDNLEPFSVIIKRMTIIFKIIAEKPDYWRYIDWDGLENLIKGLYLTLKKQERIGEIGEIKDLIHTCLKVIIADVPTPPTESGNAAGIRSTSSISFNNSIVKLSARLLYTHPKEYSLSANFQRYIRQTDPLKVDRFLVHWLLPLAIRMGTGRFDYPRMSFQDIEFISSSLILILVPKEVNRDPLSFLAKFGVQLGTTTETPPSLLNICFLGFKILLTVYPTSFGKHWKEIKRTIQKYMDKNESEILLWKFLLFVVSTRSTLLVYLLPMIRAKLSKIYIVDEPIRVVMSRIKSELDRPPVINSRSLILHQLLQELSVIAHKDKENLRRGISDEIDQITEEKELPVYDTEGGEEDDSTYISRVMKGLKQDQSGIPSDKKVPGSIMKQSNMSESSKKQVSFHGNGSVSPNQLHPSPRRGARRGAVLNVITDSPNLSPSSALVIEDDNSPGATDLDESPELDSVNTDQLYPDINTSGRLTAMFPNNIRKLSSSRSGRRGPLVKHTAVNDNDNDEDEMPQESGDGNIAESDEEEYETLWTPKAPPESPVSTSDVNIDPEQDVMVSNADAREAKQWNVKVMVDDSLTESKDEKEEVSMPDNSSEVSINVQGSLDKQDSDVLQDDIETPTEESFDSGIDTKWRSTIVKPTETAIVSSKLTISPFSLRRDAQTPTDHHIDVTDV